MHIRQATLEDFGHFVRVFELASCELAQYFWQKTAGDEGDPREVALISSDLPPETSLTLM